ncbi:MAG: hypothetical protein ACXIU7_14440 [Roseinatronobacter sp.]
MCGADGHGNPFQIIGVTFMQRTRLNALTQSDQPMTDRIHTRAHLGGPRRMRFSRARGLFRPLLRCDARGFGIGLRLARSLRARLTAAEVKTLGQWISARHDHNCRT